MATLARAGVPPVVRGIGGMSGGTTGAAEPVAAATVGAATAAEPSPVVVRLFGDTHPERAPAPVLDCDAAAGAEDLLGVAFLYASQRSVLGHGRVVCLYGDRQRHVLQLGHQLHDRRRPFELHLRQGRLRQRALGRGARDSHLRLVLLGHDGTAAVDLPNQLEQSWLAAVDAQTWGGIGMSQSNYYWGNVRNDIEWGIASYQESPTTAETFLTAGLTKRLANEFYPAAKKSGQALGGLGLEGGHYSPYQTYYMGAIVLPTLASAGRDVWTETDYWKGAVLNRIYMTPPKATVSANGKRAGWDVFPFGDDESWQDGAPYHEDGKGDLHARGRGSIRAVERRQVGPQVAERREARHRRSPAGHHGERRLDRLRRCCRWTTSTAARAISWAGRTGASTPPATCGRWATTTATATTTAIGERFKSIARAAGSRARQLATRSPMAVPTGAAGQPTAAHGFAHNVPFVNGSPGTSAMGMPASNGSSGAWSVSPVLRRLERRGAYAYADVDLSGVYKGSNSAAAHVEREYWFFRDIETFVIFNHLQTDTAARSRSFVFHCEASPMLPDATHTLCVNGDQQLAVTTLLPAEPASRTVVDESKGASPPPPAANTQYRVEINDMPNATAGYTLHVLQAMDASGTRLSPSVTDSSPGDPTTGTFTVTIDGKHSVTITKGMTSTGGSVTVSGTTSPLRADVQGFALGEGDLPAWAP